MRLLLQFVDKFQKLTDVNINEFNIQKENVFISEKIVRENLKINFCKVEKENEKEFYVRKFFIRNNFV